MRQETEELLYRELRYRARCRFLVDGFIAAVTLFFLLIFVVALAMGKIRW